MKVSYVESLASYGGPESCVHIRKGVGEAEFGRFARENRRRTGQGKPQTFDFLGFTHCCGKTRKGKFMVLRLTSPSDCEAKLQALKLELKKRMHRPIAEQGQYLKAVVSGHVRYFGVPNNGARLMTFRREAARLWHRTLSRRSQSNVT